MGLDMYLTRKTYIGAKYEHRNVEVKALDITINGKPVKIDVTKLSNIEEDILYWRKANEIHSWFVENCQDGNDDCREYDVSIDDLKTLLHLCKQIQDDHSKAKELLPTQSGFFFGSTDYDEYYFENIDDTITKLEEIISEHEDNPCVVTYSYSSSW